MFTVFSCARYHDLMQLKTPLDISFTGLSGANQRKFLLDVKKNKMTYRIGSIFKFTAPTKFLDHGSVMFFTNFFEVESNAFVARAIFPKKKRSPCVGLEVMVR